MTVKDIREFFMSGVFNDPIFTHSFRKRSAAQKLPYLNMIRNDPCAYCGGEGGTADHVVPQARGGENRDNLTGSCQPCNNAKGHKDLLTYLLEMRTA